MTRKRPSDDDLKAMLREGHFGQSPELGASDPIAATPMVVPIEHIVPYDRNPRRERNPAYEEIRESIRSSGLRQPLVISRRPGDTERFVVRAGGNTRLEILKALHAETGDTRFRDVHCLFEPWTCESDALAAHLIENDTRGDLVFIDRARAVRDLKQLVEQETGETLTQEKLAAALGERGYRLERSLISRMDYALDVLLPCIPQALRAGLGRDQVQRIRNLEKAALRLWSDRDLGEAPAFEAVFGELLARYDGPDWQLERLRRAVANEIAERADEDVHRIGMAIDALLHGREPVPLEELEAAVKAGPLIPDPRDRAPRKSDGEGTREQSSADELAGDPGDDAIADPPMDTNDLDFVAAGAGEASAIMAMLEAGRAAPGDIKSLRARAWVLATRIAKRHHLGDIVAPLAGCGCGFLVDFVYTSEIDDPDTRLGHASLWWFLATTSEQFYAPPEKVLPHLPEAWSGKPIARAIGAPDLENHTEVLAEYALLGFGHLMGPLVFAALHDRAWIDLVHLMDTYRRLRRDAVDTGVELWEPAA